MLILAMIALSLYLKIEKCCFSPTFKRVDILYLLLLFISSYSKSDNLNEVDSYLTPIFALF